MFLRTHTHTYRHDVAVTSGSDGRECKVYRGKVHLCQRVPLKLFNTHDPTRAVPPRWSGFPRCRGVWDGSGSGSGIWTGDAILVLVVLLCNEGSDHIRNLLQ